MALREYIGVIDEEGLLTLCPACGTAPVAVAKLGCRALVGEWAVFSAIIDHRLAEEILEGLADGDHRPALASLTNYAQEVIPNFRLQPSGARKTSPPLTHPGARWRRSLSH